MGVGHRCQTGESGRRGPGQGVAGGEDKGSSVVEMIKVGMKPLRLESYSVYIGVAVETREAMCCRGYCTNCVFAALKG
jgi:hypothetical protein